MPKEPLDWKSALGSLLPDDFQSEPEPEPVETAPEVNPNGMLLMVSTDSKHRKGKTITLVQGFSGPEPALEKLAKMLKTKCGVGGAVKDAEIILQGDYKQKVRDLLTQEGYKVKLK
jgi:translation initiation factor 1